MILYLDISEFLNSRITTGIQRVIREFLFRAIKDGLTLKIIYFDSEKNSFLLINSKEVNFFLQDIKNYRFQNSECINIFNKTQEKKIFFDIDSIWNSALKRTILYPKLKKYDFKICNFIYDLIPVLFPEFLYDKTKENFQPYLDAVFTYSDLVFLDSNSAQKDFLTLKKDSKIDRYIQTNVIYLGSDFSFEISKKSDVYSTLLSKKYILFVGTIEPRKEQLLVLQVYEKLQKMYPELCLVFVGKVGWNVDSLVSNIENHPLKDKTIFHYKTLDDASLSLFYKQAFIVTYLSKYEGYGLPISESLQYSNVTIASKNSSLTEVGQEFVDYIEDSSQEELIAIITKYIIDEKYYNQKKLYIKNTYVPVLWNSVYLSLSKAISKL